MRISASMRRNILFAGFGFNVLAFALERLGVNIPEPLLYIAVVVGLVVFSYGAWPVFKAIKLRPPIFFDAHLEDETKQNTTLGWATIIMLVVMVAITTILIVSGERDDFRDVVIENGVISPDKAFLRLQTNKVKNFADSHHIIAFCLAYDDQFPPYEDRLISKSDAQKINGGEMRIVVTLSQDLLRHGADQTHKELMCYTALMPIAVHPDEIVMHKSVQRLGGQFLGKGRGMSGNLFFKVPASLDTNK